MFVAGVFVLQVAVVGVLAADAIVRRDTYLAAVLIALGPFLTYSLATVPRTTFLPPTAARGAFHACAATYPLALVASLFGASYIVCVDASDTTPGLLRRMTLLTYAQRAASVADMYLITGTARLVYACCCHARMLTDDHELALLVAQLDTMPPASGQAGATRQRRGLPPSDPHRPLKTAGVWGRQPPRRVDSDDGDVELEDASVRADSLYVTRDVN